MKNPRSSAAARRRGPILLLMLILPLLGLAGCACHKCDQDKEKTRTELGAPDDVEFLEQGDRATETWFYWSLGKSVAYFWDKDECSCAVNVYTFEPLEEEALERFTADELRAIARGEQVAGELRFETSRSHPYGP